MKIESVQANNEFPNARNIKKKEGEGGFFQVFSQAMNPEKEGASETEDTKDKLSELINPLAQIINFPLLENEELIEDNIGGYIQPNSNSAKIIDISDRLPAPKVDNYMKPIIENMNMADNKILLQDNNISQIEQDNLLYVADVPEVKENRNPETNAIIPEVLETNSNSKAKQNSDLFDFGLNERCFPQKILSPPDNDIKDRAGEPNMQKSPEEPDIMKKPDVNLPNYELIDTNVSQFKNINMNSNSSPIDEDIMKENIQRVNDSIIKFMETTVGAENSVMKVKLHPEELGSVDVTLKMEDGRIIAKILVENDHVKQFFTNRLNELNDNLVRQNINIGKVQIDLNGDSNRGSSQNSRNYYRGNQVISFDNDSVKMLNSEAVYASSGIISILA